MLAAAVEGLSAKGGPPHLMQQALLECDVCQYGYCTPGQILGAVAGVREGLAGTKGDVRDHKGGNLCCCTAHRDMAGLASTVLQRTCCPSRYRLNRLQQAHAGTRLRRHRQG